MTVDETLRSQADYLDALAAAIRTVNARLDNLTRTDLEARLGVGGPVHSDMGPVPSALFGQSGPATSLGNTQSTAGQANLLNDPAIRLLTLTSFTATEQKASNEIYVKRTLNSGTAPSTNTIDQVTRENTSLNRFGSSQAVMVITGAAAACDITNEIYTKAVLTIGADGLPYLVVAIRALRRTTPWDTTSVTTLTATLELVKNIAGTPGVVSSAVIDLLTLPVSDSFQLVASAASPLTANDTYDLRVKVRFVTTGSAATNLKFALAEPQLHWGYTRDPQPYLPEMLPDFTFGGDGSDGSVTVNSGTFSAGPITSNALTRDAYFTTFTLVLGFVLDTKGYRIFCTGAAIINGTLRCNGGAGGNASGITAGTAGTTASATGAPMPSVAGQVGDTGYPNPVSHAATPGHNAVQVLPSVGSPAKGGGGGGLGGGGGSVVNGTDTAQAATPNGARQFVTTVNWATIHSGAWAILNGSDQAGAGGAGFNSGTGTGYSGGGGGSGAAGGNLVLVARIIAGAGAIEANGGAGGNGANAEGGSTSGGGGGGSGGSGGVVYLLSAAATFGGTISRAAGTAGVRGTDGNGAASAGQGGLGNLGPTETYFYMLRRLGIG